MTGAETGIVLGLLLGARHALEPDHLAAVSVLTAERPGAGRGAIVGAFWGIGHSAALLGVGLVLAILRVRMPPTLAVAFEVLVAVMLVTLGGRALFRAFSRPRAHGHRAPTASPLLVGSIHGLAGSGALTALLLAELPTASSRFAYAGLFALGSIGGMVLLSGLAGWPLARLARSPMSYRILGASAGVLSLVLGVVWGFQVLV